MVIIVLKYRFLMANFIIGTWQFIIFAMVCLVVSRQAPSNGHKPTLSIREVLEESTEFTQEMFNKLLTVQRPVT
jgi:hypothetical protein